MRYDLKLAQPRVEGDLRNALRVVIVVFSVWALGSAGFLWRSQTSEASARTLLAARTKTVIDEADSLAQKRAEASRAGLVGKNSPLGAGSSEFTVEVASLAQTAGVEVRGVQISEGGLGPGAKGAAPTGDGGSPETFECNLSGPYTALTRFLDALSDSPRLLEFTSIQIMPTETKSGSDDPRLSLKLTGLMHGLPGKP